MSHHGEDMFAQGQLKFFLIAVKLNAHFIPQLFKCQDLRMGIWKISSFLCNYLAEFGSAERRQGNAANL